MSHRVGTRKWVPEPPRVGRENAICSNIITVDYSVSLPTNKTGPVVLYQYFTSAN